MKRTIRLRENELRQMISESVRKVLKESESSELEDYFWSELESYAENNQSRENYKELVEIAEEAKQTGFNLLPCLRSWYKNHKEYYDKIYNEIEPIIL